LGAAPKLDPMDPRVRARDAALRLLNRLTFVIAFAAAGGVGVLGAVSALTIPGTTASSTTATVSSSTSADDSSSAAAASTSSSSSGLQSSSGVGSSSGGTAHAVSGASH